MTDQTSSPLSGQQMQEIEKRVLTQFSGALARIELRKSAVTMAIEATKGTAINPSDFVALAGQIYDFLARPVLEVMAPSGSTS